MFFPTIPNLFVSSDPSSRGDILSIDLSRRIYRPSQLLYNPKWNERSFVRVRSLILKVSSWSIDIIRKNTTRQDFNGVRRRSLLRRDEGYRFGIRTPYSIVQFPRSSSIVSWKGLGLYTELISTTPFILSLATITSLSGYTAMFFNVSLSPVESPSTDDRSRSSSHFIGAESIPVPFACESNHDSSVQFQDSRIYTHRSQQWNRIIAIQIQHVQISMLPNIVRPCRESIEFPMNLVNQTLARHLLG